MKSNMIIKKNTIFKLNNQEVIATREFYVDLQTNGYFFLNMWTQCDVADINILPVDYVGNLSEQELYLLKKDNVILGDNKDICLK